MCNENQTDALIYHFLLRLCEEGQYGADKNQTGKDLNL